MLKFPLPKMVSNGALNHPLQLFGSNGESSTCKRGDRLTEFSQSFDGGPLNEMPNQFFINFDRSDIQNEFFFVHGNLIYMATISSRAPGLCSQFIPAPMNFFAATDEIRVHTS